MSYYTMIRSRSNTLGYNKPSVPSSLNGNLILSQLVVDKLFKGKYEVVGVPLEGGDCRKYCFQRVGGEVSESNGWSQLTPEQSEQRPASGTIRVFNFNEGKHWGIFDETSGRVISRVGYFSNSPVVLASIEDLVNHYGPFVVHEKRGDLQEEPRFNPNAVAFGPSEDPREEPEYATIEEMLSELRITNEALKAKQQELERRRFEDVMTEARRRSASAVARPTLRGVFSALCRNPYL